MPVLRTLAVQPARLWRFLGIFQPPVLRTVHALTACSLYPAIYQQHMDAHRKHAASFSAWHHIWGGATLCLLAILQTAISSSKHGLRYFYPYLWGDTEQLMKDFKLKLVAPRPKGLGAAV